MHQQCHRVAEWEVWVEWVIIKENKFIKTKSPESDLGLFLYLIDMRAIEMLYYE